MRKKPSAATTTSGYFVFVFLPAAPFLPPRFAGEGDAPRFGVGAFAGDGLRFATLLDAAFPRPRLAFSFGFFSSSASSFSSSFSSSSASSSSSSSSSGSSATTLMGGAELGERGFQQRQLEFSGCRVVVSTHAVAGTTGACAGLFTIMYITKKTRTSATTTATNLFLRRARRAVGGNKEPRG